MNITLYPPQSAIIGHIFDYPIRYYGVIMASVFFVGILVAYLLFKKKYSSNIAEIFLDYSPLVILFSIIGARLFYVFGSFDYYFTHPSEILMINHGGLSIFGAIFFGIITLFVLSRIKKFDFSKHCDVIAVVFPLCQAIGRFGNYFNQEAYGAPTNGPIKLFVEPNYRLEQFSDVEFYHPTFLYESILDLIIFFVLFFLFFNKKQVKAGTFTCLYLFFYSLVRILVESIRIDSILNIGAMPIALLISIFVLILSLVVFFKFLK